MNEKIYITSEQIFQAMKGNELIEASVRENLEKEMKRIGQPIKVTNLVWTDDGITVEYDS